ncbi:MAG: hypothetical protein M3Z98_07230 [Candidatus Dormibacteraeota bacterium]|nr:hypothetical protein [Candidatus Dormibacteraeota bacterium]
MAFWLLVAVQWLHVLFAITWFGASLTFSFMIIPAAARLPEAEQASWWTAYIGVATQVFAIAAGGTIVFGIARGIAGGVLSQLGTPYGITWIVALVLGIALGVWGARLTGPTTERIGRSSATDLARNVAAATRIGLIELAGFFLLFTMMIAMRFGY